MKRIISFACLFACVTFTGCRSSNQTSVVKETYIHKYGVPVAKEDWESQGKDGKIVQLQKDGVTVCRQFSNGVLHGETTFTFPNNNTIHYSDQYSHAELTSRRENHPNGMPMKEAFYDHGALTKLIYWYEDGTPAATENYENGRITSGEYRTPLNVIESRVVDGQGIRIRRTSNGDFLSKDSILNGSMVERTTYHAQGDPAAITPYENDLVHGTRQTFFPGGLPNTVEQWAYGRQDGITLVYQNGEKIAEVPYINGKKNGIERRFRDGSLLVEEVSWLNNVQHGICKIYVDGETKVEWYHQGEVVSRTTFERMNLPR